jgi:hypothetical protein
VIIDEEDYLEHYGTPRHSGRWPWGTSGWGESKSEETAVKRSQTFLDRVKEMENQGLKPTEIAKGLGMTTGQLRAKKTIYGNTVKQSEISFAQRLKDKGVSNVEIGKRLGRGESYVRTLLAPGAADKAKTLTNTSDMLREELKDKPLLQIGSGVEHYLGVSQEKLRASVDILKEEGYVTHNLKVVQVGTGNETKVQVLALPGTTWADAQRNISQVQIPGRWSDDGGRSYAKIHPPLPLDPSRVDVKYAEQGGDKADGVIYVRPGIEDVSIGKKRYAQVRVQVGDHHYIKGMAIYKDDLPPGVDVQFNTKKSDTGNKLKAMKELETKNPDYPFGSIVRQKLEDQGTANERVSSVMNIVGDRPGSGEEGDWGTWTKTLSSQFLSKQKPTLAAHQLDVTYERRKKELDDINALTNPVIRRDLLEKYADSTDAAAVNLKAAALPRQSWHVILPMNSIKPDEIYAPGYNNGERVALVRFPHAGTFEIPELTVNNKHPESRRLLGPNPQDAVGIHYTVAQRLSGADFDGDTVLVIPNRSKKVTISPALAELKDFDPIHEFPIPKGSGIPIMTDEQKGQEMGKISNLITDMTIKGAPHDQIARAVKHSMVVIDAQKHELNYKESEQVNGIAALKKEYQGGANRGASTIISRATAEVRVPKRKPRPYPEGGPIDKQTGEKVYVPTGEKGRSGQDILIKSQRLAEEKDAHELVSTKRTPVELLYADHSNKLKALANQARLDAIHTPSLKRSPSAAKIYHEQVQSLRSKLTLAEQNAPLERQAQIIANQTVRAMIHDNPDLDKKTKKKIGYQALEVARTRLGSGKKKKLIDISPEEWNAIQSGAVSNSMLKDILANTDPEVVQKYATPRHDTLMTSSKTNRALDMLSLGYTRAEVARQLGVSLSTLDRATNG